MRANSRVVVLLSVLLPLGAGCARPLDPSLHDTRASGLAESRASGAAGRDTASWDILLRISGATVTLDRDFRPQVDLHTVFEFPLPTDDYLRDTIPVYSVFEKVVLRHRNGAPASLLDPVDPAGEPMAPGDRAAAPESTRGLITVRIPERAGGGERTVRVYLGFPPDHWWAGPAPERWPLSSDGDGRAVDVMDWSSFTTVPAWPPDGRPYFGPDSFRWIPSTRRPSTTRAGRGTFYELFGNRIYARSEGDTVHLGSWVVFCNGGWDRDSKYVPRVVASDPGLPPGFATDPAYAALQVHDLVGSPTGFIMRLDERLENGNHILFPASGVYPVFAPNSVYRNPVMFGYVQVLIPGTAYIMARAVDSEGNVDTRITAPSTLAERVDAGLGTPEEVALRPKVIQFYVRDAPTLESMATLRSDRAASARRH